MSDTHWQTPAAAGGERAIDWLALHSPLPRQRLKDAMEKGAVWLQRGRHEQRLRRATKALQDGDRLALYYNPELLSRQAPPPALLHDKGRFSVWDKAAGMLAQGTRYGDHCALLRHAEKQLAPRPAFLVHRLDREASGLMVVAHDRAAAAALSKLWQTRAITKRYAVTVVGNAGEPGSERMITTPLDGQAAETHFCVVSGSASETLLEVSITTGRKHQIRRHLAGVGLPVVGDWRYGSGGASLALRAVRLAFTDPWLRRETHFDAPLQQSPPPQRERTAS